MKTDTPSTPDRKTPTLMDAAAMKKILRPYQEQNGDCVFINNEIGILHGNPKWFKLVVLQKAPFIINDHRLGIIVRGTGQTNVNLVDKPLKAGMFVYLAPGTIIHPATFSDDFEIYGIALFDGFTLPFTAGNMPSAFNGHVRDILLSVDDADLATGRLILDTLWHLVRQPDYPRSVASSLVAALMHLFHILYCRDAEQASAVRSHEQTIFDRFIQLVNQHCQEQHQIAYYAGRICLTERYLSSLVSKTSGITAKEWIDRALIMRIKVELIHTNKPIASIADQLNFPNSSFFNKYFKRLVGITPGEYRRREAVKR